MELIRNCPECDVEIEYNSALTYNRGLKNNSICKSCSGKKTWEKEENRLKIIGSKLGKKQSVESNIKRSLTLKGRILSDQHKIKIGLGNKNKKASQETRLKISQSKIGISWNGKHTELFKKQMSDRLKNNKIWLGRKHTNITKNKQRISRIKDIIKKYGYAAYPNFNKKACKIIDEYGNKNGYNFQHAMNGGEFYIRELGYWVDGYDNDKNTVIEYYEKRHNNSIYEDLERENKICKYLGCDFIILYE